MCSGFYEAVKLSFDFMNARAQTLGHKNIKNMLLYIQFAEELFKDQQKYVSKVAKNEKDVCALVEAGFEYVCDFNNFKIKKQKY